MTLCSEATFHQIGAAEMRSGVVALHAGLHVIIKDQEPQNLYLLSPPSSLIYRLGRLGPVRCDGAACAGGHTCPALGVASLRLPTCSASAEAKEANIDTGKGQICRARPVSSCARLLLSDKGQICCWYNLRQGHAVRQR
jgi:hypothetical protein